MQQYQQVTKAKKQRIGEKWGKNQLNRIAVSNIKWFDF